MVSKGVYKVGGIKMKKLFISQPINGKTDKEVLKERKEAIKRIEERLMEPVELIGSFIVEDPPSGINLGLWYLGKSLECLSQADIAYFVKGWESARGCVIENTCAIKYGIDIVIEDYSGGCTDEKQ